MQDFLVINSNSKTEDIWSSLRIRLGKLRTPEVKSSDEHCEVTVNSKTEKDSVEVLSRKITNKVINSGFGSRGKEINDLRRSYLKSLKHEFDEKLFEDFIMENLKK